MMKITRLGWTAYAIAAVTVAVDQLSKLWVLATLGDVQGASQPLLGPVHLTLVYNRGMSFGLLRNPEFRWLLSLFAGLIVVALAIWARKSTRPLMAVGLGLIIGGAIGNNLIDRIAYGHVVDFIDVTRLHFKWVFNGADSAINIGVALLLIDSFVSEEKKMANPEGHGL